MVGDSSRRSPEEQARLTNLTTAVYPPGEAEGWPGRELDWSPPERDIWVFDEHDRLVSYAAVLLRRASLDGRPVHIGGVGGVKTLPEARGRGFAGAAMEEARLIWVAGGADFGLLVCEPGLIDYYQRTGWTEFEGTVLSLQKGEVVPFEFNRVMLLPVGMSPPETGVIDLQGPPW